MSYIFFLLSIHFHLISWLFSSFTPIQLISWFLRSWYPHFASICLCSWCVSVSYANSGISTCDSLPYHHIIHTMDFHNLLLLVTSNYFFPLFYLDSFYEFLNFSTISNIFIFLKLGYTHIRVLNRKQNPIKSVMFCLWNYLDLGIGR